MKNILLLIFAFCPVFTSYGMFESVGRKLIDRKKAIQELEENLANKDGAIANLKAILTKLEKKLGLKDVEIKKLISIINNLKLDNQELRKLVLALKKELKNKGTEVSTLKQKLFQLSRDFNKLKEKNLGYKQRENNSELISQLVGGMPIVGDMPTNIKTTTKRKSRIGESWPATRALALVQIVFFVVVIYWIVGEFNYIDGWHRADEPPL